MKQKKLSPADYVIFIFKGVRATARLLKQSPSSVSRWRNDGNIPSVAQRKILTIARIKKIDITPQDLIYGRVIEMGV